MSDKELLDKTYHFIMKQPDYFSNMKSCFGELFEHAVNNDKIGPFLKS